MSLDSLTGDLSCGRAISRQPYPPRMPGSRHLDETDVNAAERLLAQSAEHRVLRRVPTISEWPLAAIEGPTRRALFIDIKTTGPSIETDQVMELGAVAFDYDLQSGAIVWVDDPVSFDDIEAPEVAALTEHVQLVVAHDAAFVRPMVEKGCEAFVTKNWAGSLHEIDWASEGLVSVRVDDLLMRMGWFNDHVDVAGRAVAGAFLMSLTLPGSKAPALRVLLSRARRTLMAVRADGTAFEKRDQLKERGYRWDADTVNPGWWILTDHPQTEIVWLNAMIYQHPREITPIPAPATRRYSARLWRE